MSKTLLYRTLNEGIELMQEVRNYIAYHEKLDRKEFDMFRCLCFGYHQTRITSRLLQSLTWILAMQALICGEITPSQFCLPQFSFENSEESESDSGELNPDLPLGLRDLLIRSRMFYMRIRRLDSMAIKNIEYSES